jgi:hypothetical protein
LDEWVRVYYDFFEIINKLDNVKRGDTLTLTGDCTGKGDTESGLYVKIENAVFSN